MSVLITRTRALRNLAGLTPTAAEETTIDGLLAAVSEGIEQYCRRRFTSQPHDECHDGGPGRYLFLEQYPIVSVERVAFCPQAVLTVTNTLGTNQRAAVKVTATGLTLARVASGVTYTTALTFSGNATLSAMATAINALGNGWSAAVVDGFSGDWASADLHAIQGAYHCRNVLAGLRLHVLELSAYEVDEARGCLLRTADDELALLDEQNPWFGGGRYWRILYTAGYDTVPEDVQEACAQWVAALFWATKRDPGAAQLITTGVGTLVPYPEMPPAVRGLLRPYRVYRLALGFTG